MTEAKPVAIVLGGTNAHVPLIENLRARGYSVVLADYIESPPASRVADEHDRTSTLDLEAVLALARARDAALVIATCVDQANVTAAYVAERLGLPAPYGFAVADRIADKVTMKEGLAVSGVPVAGFRLLRSAAEAEWFEPEFPVVVKPIDCGGSKGVRRAADRGEFRLAVADAFGVTRADAILVERFCAGLEVLADCFVQDGEAQILMLRKKYVERDNAQTVLCGYASVAPVDIGAAARERIVRAIDDIVRGFGLRTTPLLVQFMVDGDDVRVIEFAPRAGGGLNHRMVLLWTGFDVVDAGIDAYLGRRYTRAATQGSGYLPANHVYADAGVFGELRNQDRLIASGVVEEFYAHKSRGARIGASFAASDRVASFIVRAADAEDLLRKTRKAIEVLDVLDGDGRSIIRRAIHLRAL